MGARSDVQNFGACKAPAAPVLTQAKPAHRRKSDNERINKYLPKMKLALVYQTFKL